MIDASSDLTAIDSTGMDASRSSRYYSQRRNCHYHRFPKLSAVTDVNSHLFLGVVVDRGPKPDDLEFDRLVRQAHRRHPFDALLGDPGYDAERHHEFLFHGLGVIGIIPPIRGRPPTREDHVPTGFFRRTLKAHWPIAEYGQRWQIETSFSMLKRLLGSAVRSRCRHAIDREIYLKAITINLMIVWPVPCCFQQSRLQPLQYWRSMILSSVSICSPSGQR